MPKTTRQDILDKARSLSAGDEVQFIGHTDDENHQAELALEAINKLKTLRALWKKET